MTNEMNPSVAIDDRIAVSSRRDEENGWTLRDDGVGGTWLGAGSYAGRERGMGVTDYPAVGIRKAQAAKSRLR
jgi:hypothetical protein